MMRTVEVIIVIGILASAFVIGSFFAVLPSPRQVSSVNLEELALTTLQMFDQNNELNQIVFKSNLDASWGHLQAALTASLPPNILYNFAVYNMTNTGQYKLMNSFSNTKTGLGISSETASIIVPSSNVTFSFTPQKIPRTLYILNCSDANGWWITGYTAQSLATAMRNLLALYFNTTIIVQNTTQLGSLLDGTKISSSPYENVTNAVILNTFGEAVPIPSSYANQYSQNSYARYDYELGKRTNTYNWTWVSIVGWPLYYVSNTNQFSSNQNTFGIYGMIRVGPPGLAAFLMGLNGQSYVSPGNSQTGSPGVVSFTSSARNYSNYYGIYPSANQTSTRAIPSSYLQTYNLNVSNAFGYVFNPADSTVGNCIPAATYNHMASGKIQGSLTAIGLTRIPDIRITALALLMYYRPSLYPSVSTSSGSTRLVVLQLGLQGGG